MICRIGFAIVMVATCGWLTGCDRSTEYDAESVPRLEQSEINQLETLGPVDESYTNEDTSAASTIEPDVWLRYPESVAMIYTKEDDSLTAGAIHEVPADKLRMAEQLLEPIPCLQVTADEAQNLLGRPLDASEKKLFLVRGLCRNRTNGHFAVTFANGTLVVNHASMGPSPGDMERQPLILELASKPLDVYVYCSVLP